MVWFLYFYVSVVMANFALGLSSLDQMFFGTVLGAWLGYLCNDFFRKPLYRHITKLLNGEYHVTGYRGILRVLLVIVVLDFLIVNGIYAYVSYMSDYDDPHKLSWWNDLQAVCPKEKTYNRIMFANAEYAVAYIQLMSLGAYLGILCDSKFFSGTHRDIHNTSVRKGIMRVIITALIFSPFLILVNVKSIIASYITILFLIFIMPSFLSGFIFFAFSR